MIAAPKSLRRIRVRFNALATLPTQDPDAAIVESPEGDHRAGILRGGHQRAHPGKVPGRTRVRRATRGHRGTRRTDLSAPHLSAAGARRRLLQWPSRTDRQERWPPPPGDGAPKPVCTYCDSQPPASSADAPSCRSSSDTWARTCRSPSCAQTPFSPGQPRQPVSGAGDPRTRTHHHLRLHHHDPAAAVRPASVRRRPHHVLQRLPFRRPGSTRKFPGRSPDQPGRPGRRIAYRNAQHLFRL